MTPNSHCDVCRYRTVEVYFQGQLTPAMIDPVPNTDGLVWLTGRRIDGTIMALRETHAANIPSHVAIRYDLHKCPCNGGA